MHAKSKPVSDRLFKTYNCMHVQHVYIEAQIEHLRILISSSSLSPAQKESSLHRLSLLEVNKIKALCETALHSLTAVRVRYIITFLIDMDVSEIATLFNIEAATVYSIRYRLRKLFPPTTMLPF